MKSEWHHLPERGVATILALTVGSSFRNSTLVCHEATSEVPQHVHIALPRGTSALRAGHPPLRGHHFSGSAMTAGIDEVEVDGVPVRVFHLAKPVADCFRISQQDRSGRRPGGSVGGNPARGVRPAKVLDYARLCLVQNVIPPISRPWDDQEADRQHGRVGSGTPAGSRTCGGGPFDELLLYFAMERFLYHLWRSGHAEQFILKGALMLQFWGCRSRAPRGTPVFLDGRPSGWMNSWASCGRSFPRRWKTTACGSILAASRARRSGWTRFMMAWAFDVRHWSALPGSR